MRQGLCFLFLFLSCACVQAAQPQVCHDHDCVSVEVVSKQVDMERGLMYRTGLAPKAGMLFIFASEGRQSFWMQNMRFNLDILWIDSRRRIVYIGRGIPACRTDSCPVYTPDEPARYVLEVNSGFSDAHHWKEGDKLIFNDILKK
ncbi:MAG: DUF192 domain-containing protein [Candidatus Omnitrophica bacterium]|nr:DUF192 domain-containing protein [Candidatus Omnitrophota bacterium]MDE2222340.1 DUF192 domain-containing protein [Candidatus Omnitrophota bacterium]